jgi:hypothetical protein
LNTQWVSNVTSWLFNRHGVIAILFSALPLFMIQMIWDMESARYPLGFTLMLYGYIIGWNSIFWQRISQNIKPLLIAFVMCYCAFIAFYNLVWSDVIHGVPPENENILMLGMFNYSLLRVLGGLTIFAVAHKFLNVKSTRLSYFNDAVYPFYILHQTFILVIGYNLSKLHLGPIVEPILLIILTVSSCFVGYELIRRTELLRPFFGLKMKGNYGIVIQRTGYIVAMAFIIPIGWRII